MSGFSVVKKTPSHWKKIFIEKQCFQPICADKNLDNGVWKCFRNKWVSGYFTFGDFTIPKCCSS